jgi:hypothetical protein
MDKHDDRIRCSIRGHASAVLDNESSKSCLNMENKVQKQLVLANNGQQFALKVAREKLETWYATCRKRHLKMSSKDN